MRGNHGHILSPAGARWSIPAYAGEPVSVGPLLSCSRVYPRVCGGTRPQQRPRRRPQGLSPRMRGNRCRQRPQVSYDRSIPAYAGEPRLRPSAQRVAKVYPRVCGGTDAGVTAGGKDDGLSPRMRGNLSHHAHHPELHGSIPAYAGEPIIVAGRNAADTVYPRVCGGTGRPFDMGISGIGLSPRMRGNLPNRIRRMVISRSIPAYAGEPPPATPPGPARTVYPRVCGGTVAGVGGCCANAGLSPRMRGNPADGIRKK